jgi:hypothetical protein
MHKSTFFILTFSLSHVLAVSQNVGLGITDPEGKLHIKGSSDASQLIIDAHNIEQDTSPLIRLRNSSGSDLMWIHSDNASNVFIGRNSGRVNDPVSGLWNIFVGNNAGLSNTSGHANSAVGHNSLRSNSSGWRNTAIGYEALFMNASGNHNSSLGYWSLKNNTSGSNNTALGSNSLLLNSTGDGNTAIGNGTLSAANSDGSTAIGYGALGFNSAEFQTAVGYNALLHNSTGNHNTAIGSFALETNTLGSYNNAIGYETLFTNLTGHSNSAFGTWALYGNSSGQHNIAVGRESLESNTNGDGNTAVGNYALYTNVTGNYNTTLGYFASPDGGSSPDNFSAIGYSSGGVVSNSNTIEIGNTSVSWIGGQSGWSTFSDARIKDDIQSNVPGLEFITKLNPVTYKLNIHRQNALCGIIDTAMWDGKYDIEQITQSGFLAQEVEQAAREVDYDFNGITPPEGNAPLYSLQYSAFVVPLVKAVQEQQQMIDGQNRIIDELRKEIEQLKLKF